MMKMKNQPQAPPGARHRKVLTMRAMHAAINQQDPSFYPVEVPDGVAGSWTVETFELQEKDVFLSNLRALRDQLPEYLVIPGTYKRLRYRSLVVMSNTQFEYRTNRPFIEIAQGHVLVTGLGLGMILRPLAEREQVKSITVIERSQEVIDLVAPSYADLTKLHIIKGDAFYWRPATMKLHYDMAWHDVWSSFGPEKIKDYERIKRHFRRYARWQACWAEFLSRRMERIEHYRKLETKGELQP